MSDKGIWCTWEERSGDDVLREINGGNYENNESKRRKIETADSYENARIREGDDLQDRFDYVDLKLNNGVLKDVKVEETRINDERIKINDVSSLYLDEVEVRKSTYKILPIICEIPLYKLQNGTTELIEEFQTKKKLTEYTKWVLKCKERGCVIGDISAILERVSEAEKENKIVYLKYVKPKQGHFHYNQEEEVITFNINKCVSMTVKGNRLYEAIIEILKLFLESLKSNVILTKRGLFYKRVNIFKTQALSDQIIDILTINLGVPRCCVAIAASPKGIIYGNIVFNLRNGEKIHCHNSNEHGVTIPSPNDIARIEYEAKFILVLEKATIMAELISMNFNKKYGSSILVSGGGYPDVRTRNLLKRLSSMNKDIKIYILTDLDPYGIDIFINYKYGTQKIPCNTAKFEWIDLSTFIYSSQNNSFFVHNTINLTTFDARKIINMLRNKNEILKMEYNLKKSLQFILLHSYKHEIELTNINKIIDEILIPQINPASLKIFNYTIDIPSPICIK